MTHVASARIAALDRGAFELPTVGRDRRTATYLCGHSLGPLPRSARTLVEAELSRWSALGVRGHFEGEPGWVDVTEPLRAPLAELVGAAPDEVVAMNALGVNLHLMLASFLRPQGARDRILVAEHAFPSDRLAVESHCRWHGRDPREAVVAVPACAAKAQTLTQATVREIERQGDRLALVCLDAVDYLTGEALDLEAVVRAAHGVGALVGFDLAHAIGNLPLGLARAGADFAVWCSYKYLNAGPGALGGAYVHRRHHGEDLPRLRGWWGLDPDDRFAWQPQRRRPARSAAAWQVSNPPVLEATTLRAALEVFRRHPMMSLRARGLALHQAARRALAALAPGRLAVLTPDDPARHGAMLALGLPAGRAASLEEALLARGVVADVRGEVLRVAFCPLYNDETDVHQFVAALEECL